MSTTCCLCIPLRTAVILIGYLAIIDCMIVAVKCLAGIEHEMITLVTITANEPPSQVKCRGLTVLCICRGIFNLLLVLLCVALLMGVYKGVAKFMELWLIAFLVLNVLDLMLIMTAIVWIGGSFLFFYLALILFKFYCLFMVYRYYCMLRTVCDCEIGEDDDDEDEDDDNCCCNSTTALCNETNDRSYSDTSGRTTDGTKSSKDTRRTKSDTQ